MAVEKAWIEVETGANIGTGGTITCMFNPEKLNLSKSASWMRKKGTSGGNAPSMEFSEGEASSLTLDLTLDTSDTGESVTRYTDMVLKLMEVNDALPTQSAIKKRPPWVRFHWGDWHSFKSYVKSANLSFTYFSSSGVPLRATAAVSLEQVEDDPSWLPQNPTSGTPEPHQVHDLQVGETLDRLAARYYGQSTRWRVIADANGIDDPLRLAPGTRLKVPLAGDVLDD